MDDALYQQMYVMEQRHWWFTGKHRVVEDLLRRYLPDRPPGERHRVIDLGCGCGFFLQKLRDRYDVRGMDTSPVAVEFCARRGVGVDIGFLPDDVPAPRGEFNAVLLLDVLEHLEHDRASAEVAASLLRPGGIMVCTVPAYQWLWSKRDEHHHHKRRYSAAQFRRLFDQPDLRLELFSHYNTWLFPLAAAARLAARVRPPRDAGADLKLPPAPANAALRAVFASERHLLGRLPLPFGLSLVAVARKTA